MPPRPARSTPSLLADLHLLTAKPFIYVFNVDEGRSATTRRCAPSWRPWSPRPSRWSLCAQIEAEVAALDPEDAAELLAGYGQDESGSGPAGPCRASGPSGCRPS